MGISSEAPRRLAIRPGQTSPTAARCSLRGCSGHLRGLRRVRWIWEGILRIKKKRNQISFHKESLLYIEWTTYMNTRYGVGVRHSKVQGFLTPKHTTWTTPNTHNDTRVLTYWWRSSSGVRCTHPAGPACAGSSPGWSRPSSAASGSGLLALRQTCSCWSWFRNLSCWLPIPAT